MGKINENLPKPLTTDLQAEAIKILKNTGEVFDILINEEKEKLAKLYVKCLREAIKDYNSLYKEIKEIKADKPEILEEGTGKILMQAGISRPLKEKRDGLIKKANDIADMITAFKNKNFEPLLKQYEKKFNTTKNE